MWGGGGGGVKQLGLLLTLGSGFDKIMDTIVRCIIVVIVDFLTFLYTFAFPSALSQYPALLDHL